MSFCVPDKAVAAAFFKFLRTIPFAPVPAPIIFFAEAIVTSSEHSVVDVCVTAPVTARVDDNVAAPVTQRVPPTTVLPLAPATVNLFVLNAILDVEEPVKFSPAPRITAPAIIGLPLTVIVPLTSISPTYIGFLFGMIDM